VPKKVEKFNDYLINYMAPSYRLELNYFENAIQETIIKVRHAVAE